MARHVVLVCGPPCSGKSHLVAAHAVPGDLVLCVDKFAVDAGSPAEHNHPGRYYRAAEDRFWAEVDWVRRQRFVTAWVIRCAPSAEARRELTRAAGATRVVVLAPPPAVLRQRALLRDHPADGTLRAIDSWYRRYTPGFGETVRTS